MNTQIRDSLYTAMFAALIVVGTYLKIPVGPVPIVLANFFVLLSGLLMGWKAGLASVALYLLLGIIGLPVFSGGGGIGVLIGPTGGYLFGYLVAVFLTGLISGIGSPSVLKDTVAVTAATLAIYAAGVPWLKLVTGMAWQNAFVIGMLPFLIGDALKIAAAVVCVRVVRKTAPELFPRGSAQPHRHQGRQPLDQ